MTIDRVAKRRGRTMDFERLEVQRPTKVWGKTLRLFLPASNGNGSANLERRVPHGGRGGKTDTTEERRYLASASRMAIRSL